MVTFDKVSFHTIDEASAGQRIDNFLLKLLKGVPKSHIYKLLRQDEVRVNKKRVKAHKKLQLGDEIRLAPVRVAEREDTVFVGDKLREHLEQAICFENEGILILNKPAGLAVHGGSGVSVGLIEAMRVLRPDAKFLELVHRLDRATSGLIILAKSRPALLEMHRQMREGEIRKTYRLVVEGRWPKALHKVDVPLDKRHKASGERMVKVSRDGKASLTHFNIVQKEEDVTVLEAILKTGRTHQIRVHTLHAGHPILGDDRYFTLESKAITAKRNVKRLCLHSFRLKFTLYDEVIQVEAPCPLS
jgi:23S rRNA pseudouridine955/2504/2580 synthase